MAFKEHDWYNFELKQCTARDPGLTNLCTRLVTLQRFKRSRLQEAIVVVPIGSPRNAKTRQVNKLF